MVKGKYFLVILLIGIFAGLPILCKQEPQLESTKNTDLVTISKINKDAQLGAVTLPHVKHEKAGVKCVVCHHKKNNDDRIKICARCHGEGADELMHNLCVNCHKEKKKGPTDCTACHREEKT